MAVPAKIALPAEYQLGPAMRALVNDRQRAFVVALVMGAKNHTEAAKMAGYVGKNDTVKVTAHRLAHDEGVQAAIQEEARRTLQAGGLKAASVAIGLLDSADEKVRLKAAETVMNRAGLHALTEHKVTVENVSESETLREVKEALARLGLTPVQQREYLKNAGVTDVEFEEVTPGVGQAQ